MWREDTRRKTGRGLAALVPGVLLGVAALTAPAAAEIDFEAWSTYRTPHFTILSNADRDRALEIAAGLERFRAAFSQWSPELELNSPVPTRILAFRDADSYAPFKSGRESDRARILGQFLAHRDGNFITLDADRRYLGGFGVVLHEYVHYLVQHNFPGVPRWFNEGLAEYYSTFTVDGEAALIGVPVDRHLQWIKTHDDLRLADLLETTGQAAHLYNDEQVGHFYALSWGLVHYLLSNAGDRGSQLAEFLDLAAAGEPPGDAFEKAFDLRLTDLEDDLRRYYLAPELPVARVPLESLDAGLGVEVETTRAADLASVLGDLVARQGLETRAESFYSLALAYDPGHAEAHAGLAYVRDLQQRLEEAEILFRDALELGPSEARTFLLYGRHLLTRMQVARRQGDALKAGELAQAARATFRDAVRLDPDFAETRAMLGYAHLFLAGDPSAGVEPLETARRMLPGRADVVFHLLQLRLKLGEFDRARALLDGTLTRIADEEMVFRAREEIERAELLRAANEAMAEGRHEEGLRFLDDAISVTSDPDVRASLESELRRLEARLER